MSLITALASLTVTAVTDLRSEISPALSQAASLSASAMKRIYLYAVHEGTTVYEKDYFCCLFFFSLSNKNCVFCLLVHFIHPAGMNKGSRLACYLII